VRVERQSGAAKLAVADRALTRVCALLACCFCADDFSLDGSSEAAPPQEEAADRPTILSQLVKTTVIKRADEFAVSADNGQRPDVIIFSCQDSYIYILGPVRYLFHLPVHLCSWSGAVSAHLLAFACP